ncbi:Regulator of chromosome condensation 1/beta-lactamase-inhibitor protein II [Phytophthora cactorum]|nr:Regulator of chromosome condensation 1/beta-lactamase-inhibitor protein II [Phytophthora cactorum]
MKIPKPVSKTGAQMIILDEEKDSEEGGDPPAKVVIVERTPRLIEGLNGHVIVEISAGNHFAVAITSTGQVFSWGRAPTLVFAIKFDTHQNINAHDVASEGEIPWARRLLRLKRVNVENELRELVVDATEAVYREVSTKSTQNNKIEAPTSSESCSERKSNLCPAYKA